MKSTKHDEEIKVLQQKVEEKKKQIKKSERPTYVTNNAFPSNTGTRNILTIQNVEELVELFSQVCAKKSFHDDTNTELGTNVPFFLGGYSYDSWLADFKTRITYLEISKERKKLEDLEKMLTSLESEDVKVSKELDKIRNLLS